MKGSRNSTDLHLADVLGRQIEGESPDALLSEVAEDFGDRRTLAKEFDRACAQAMAQDRRRRLVGYFHVANWKPVAMTAVLIIVAAASAFYVVDRNRQDALSRISQTEIYSHALSAQSEQRSDAELAVLQARFELVRAAGDRAATKSAAEQYLLLAKERYGEEHPLYAKGLNDVAVVDIDAGNYRDAESAFRQSLAIMEKALGRDQPSVAATLEGLGSLYLAQGRIEEAQTVLRESLSIAEKALGAGHPDVVRTRAKLADARDRLTITLGARRGAKPEYKQIAHTGEQLKILRGQTNAVDFNPEGSRLATASQAGVQVWDVATGQVTAEVAAPRASLLSLTFALNEKIVATYADGTTFTWTPGQRPTLESRTPSAGQVLVLSSDGRQLIATDNNAVRLLDRTGGVATYIGHSGLVTSAAFDPAGARVVTVSNDKTIRIWDTQTARPLSVLRGPSTPVRAVFSRDGKQIVSTGKDDPHAYLWDAMGLQRAVLSGHSGPVLYALFSPDGQRVITTSVDGTARLWSAPDGTAKAILNGHEGAVTSAAFSSDGALIATTSEDRTVRLWRAE